MRACKTRSELRPTGLRGSYWTVPRRAKTPGRTGQPPLDQCYVFQIMLVGVASDVTPQGHTFRPGKALGVDQIFFAGGLYGLFNLRVGAAEIGQDPGERARLTLLVELLVEPVYVLISLI